MITFNDFGIQETILKSIKELGFETPTPVQEQAIPHLLQETEEDLLAFAQTGTGKTAAFGIPVIEQIDVENKNVQSIILAPTRELCMQIAKDLSNYSKYLKGLNIVAVYGGASIETQIKALKNGAQIVVGTPGRTVDLIHRKKLKLSGVKWLILDEADEMLNMGFKDELDKILAQTPEEKQTLLFSATMPKEVLRIAKTYMHNPKEIKIGHTNSGAENVEHKYYLVSAANKYEALKRIADITPDIYGIVFCRTRRDAKEVASKLIKDGYNADALHGDLSQSQRDNVMDRFRAGNLQILVATDVAARGLDVDSLTHVINYSLPDDPEVYIHRSGRTGRAGKSGLSISIIHSREISKIKALEKMTKKSFVKTKVPGGEEIVHARLFNVIDKIKNTEVDEERIKPFLDKILPKFDDVSKDELIKKLVSVEFTRFINYYSNSKDINLKEGRREDSRDKKDRKRSNTAFSRFYINLGTKQGLNASTLIGLINEKTDSNNIEIGKIDLMKGFSFFEADKKSEKAILKKLNNSKFKSQRIVIELANDKVVKKDENSYGKRRNRKKKKSY